MSLPTVRTNSEWITLTPQALDAIMKTAAGSVDAVQYFVERYKETLGPKASPALIEQLNEWAELVVAGLTEPAEVWDGIYIKRKPMTHSLLNLSEEAIKNTGIALREGLQLDFAINQEAQLLRAYSSNNEPLAEETLEAMDLSFNAWLLSHDILVEDGVLYALDADDKRTRVHQADIENLIQDETNGFKKHLQDKGISLTIRQLPYPQAEATPTPVA